MSSQGKALNAILPLIAAGQAYEGHQKARTFASRYLKSNAYDTAIQVLFQSARELLKGGHAGSGTDLGTFLIEVYYAKEQDVNDTSRGMLFGAYYKRSREDLVSSGRYSHTAYWPYWKPRHMAEDFD